MENIGSTKLKTSLNSYLKEVKKGQGFIILDRGKPIAKLVPIGDGEVSDPDEIIASLTNRGLLELNDLSKLNELKTPTNKPVKLNKVSASKILLEDRD